MVESNKTVQKTYQNIKFVLKDILENRDALLHRHRCLPIYDSEKDELTIDRKVELFERSYCFKKSRFLNKHPSQIGALNLGTEYPVIFNDRIYFMISEEQRQIVLKNPLKWLCNKAPPHDINLIPNICQFGKYRSGKSELAKLMQKELGIINLKLKNVINHFKKNPWDVQAKQLKKMLVGGQSIDDDQVIDLLYKRLQLKDVNDEGYVLNGWPKNHEQTIKLLKKGIKPLFGITFGITDTYIKERAIDQRNGNAFKFDRDILNMRLESDMQNINMIEQCFSLNYRNLRYFFDF